jgi:hypothetical protein
VSRGLDITAASIDKIGVQGVALWWGLGENRGAAPVAPRREAENVENPTPPVIDRRYSNTLISPVIDRRYSDSVISPVVGRRYKKIKMRLTGR